jgi:hypothetical protein
MYERHEHADRQRITAGWLIARCGDGESDSTERRYLQIGTGQWCGAAYATLFPRRRTAIIYAIEFGYVVGRTAVVVPYQRQD